MRNRLLYGIQQLNRRRVSTLVIALLIASAVCASATLSEIFDRFILATLPVAKPTGLLLVEKRQGAEMVPSNLLTYTEMDALSRRADIFSSVVAEQTPSAWPLVPIGDDPVNSQLASAISYRPTISRVWASALSSVGFWYLPTQIHQIYQRYSVTAFGILSFPLVATYSAPYCTLEERSTGSLEFSRRNFTALMSIIILMYGCLSPQRTLCSDTA